MKKTAIICLVLILGICVSACGKPSLELNTLEKIAEVYYTNEEYFNTAAETVLKYDGTERRIGIDPIERAVITDAYVGKEIGGLYIDGSSSLTDSDFQILYDAFAPLFERVHFSGAAMYASRVEFMLEGPNAGFAAELYYFADADFAASYMSQTDSSNYLMIDPHWYAEFWSD